MKGTAIAEDGALLVAGLSIAGDDGVFVLGLAGGQEKAWQR